VAPKEIEGEFPGSGYGNVNGKLTMSPAAQLAGAGRARYPAPAGGNAAVMFGMSSFDDRLPARGWFFAYDAKTLEKKGTFVTTPSTVLGSIWMSGTAPAIDAQGGIYFATANGDPDYAPADTDYEDSIVRLAYDPDLGFSVADFFTPFNRAALADFDIDLGSGGVMLLPDYTDPNHPEVPRHLLAQAGKEGTIYLLNRDNMGRRQNPAAGRNAGIWQELPRVLSPETPNSFNTGEYGAPSYYNNRVYFAPYNGTLRSFRFKDDGGFDTTPESVASELITGRGASTSISSDNNTNGIVWMIDDSAYGYSGWNPDTLTVSGVRNGPAVLYAYDAEDLTTPIYASNAQGHLDDAGNAAKFAVPTVAGGRVYVATQAEVTVYGRLADRVVPMPSPTPKPPSKLSLTGLFKDLATLAPADGMIEYSVNSPLWSDNAAKRRWIKLPPGGQIAFDPVNPWVFPVGTQMVKHFELALADGTTTRLETRVMTYGSQGWSGISYQWTQDQSDAVAVPQGGAIPYTVADPAHPGTTRTQTWHFPNTNDCLTCHNSVAGFALGVNTRQLNKPFAYDSGAQNQLSYLNSLHAFTQDIGDPAQYQSYVAVNDANQSMQARSRSYLATNCAFCHQPGGTANLDMDFRAETDLADMNVVNVAPLHGNGGVAGATRLTPGNHAASVIWLRMNTLAPGRMPPIGSSMVDVDATFAIGSWIDGVTAADAMARTAPPAAGPGAKSKHPVGQFPGGKRNVRYLPGQKGKPSGLYYKRKAP
jgi:uncharacterized repeat protein (TIGR03806 family)